MISIKIDDQNRVFFVKTYVSGDDENYIVVDFVGNPMMMLYSNGELISDDVHKRYVLLEEKSQQGLTKSVALQIAMSSIPADVNGNLLVEEDETFTAWKDEVLKYLDMFDDTEITQEVINNVPKYPLS